MLAMARQSLNRQQESSESRHGAGVKSFRKMSRGVRVLSRLQLPGELLQRLGRRIGSADAPDEPDVVFYTGCNILKTPHIALLCLDLMDTLGVSYRVMGGPSHCCGVLQFRAGDVATSGDIAYRTIDRFSATRSGEVLSWCPTCQIQLGEIALPSYAESQAPAPFDLTPFVVFLERHLDRLRPLMAERVEKRVALHEHSGLPEATSAARRILEAIPGLELIDLEQSRAGYMCNSLRALPDFKRDVQADMLEAATAAGVTTLAGASMGLHRPDLFKRLKLMQDVDAIITDAEDMIARHGLTLDEVREVILQDMLGEGFDLRPAASGEAASA
jgi:Fe-S oxidoreductase